MGKIITIANAKGGVAKTTTSIYLANELSKYGKVLLKDSDPQGSVTEWLDELETVPFDFALANKKTMGKSKEDYDYIIIDTPPLTEDIITSATNVADLVIMPTSPSAIELDRVLDMLDNQTNKKKVRVLVNNADTRTSAFKYIKELLKEEGILYLDNYVRMSEAIRNSYKKTYKPSADYEKVAKEIRGLLNE